ncbi:MAG TPA: hypothetical protein VLA04_04335 [Verrucomicrobiae bacterium]|nr:hypothetical protein [Verrucomicrobiae bacterium]
MNTKQIFISVLLAIAFFVSVALPGITYLETRNDIVKARNAAIAQHDLLATRYQFWRYVPIANKADSKGFDLIAYHVNQWAKTVQSAKKLEETIKDSPYIKVDYEFPYATVLENAGSSPYFTIVEEDGDRVVSNAFCEDVDLYTEKGNVAFTAPDSLPPARNAEAEAIQKTKLYIPVAGISWAAVFLTLGIYWLLPRCNAIDREILRHKRRIKQLEGDINELPDDSREAAQKIRDAIGALQSAITTLEGAKEQSYKERIRIGRELKEKKLLEHAKDAVEEAKQSTEAVTSRQRAEEELPLHTR